jgi:hypothetical protein
MVQVIRKKTFPCLQRPTIYYPKHSLKFGFNDLNIHLWLSIDPSYDDKTFFTF